MRWLQNDSRALRALTLLGQAVAAGASGLSQDRLMSELTFMAEFSFSGANSTDSGVEAFFKMWSRLQKPLSVRLDL